MKKLFRELRKDLPEWFHDIRSSPVGRFASWGWLIAMLTMFTVDLCGAALHGWGALFHGAAVGSGIAFGWYAGRAALTNQHERHMAEIHAAIEKIERLNQRAGVVQINSSRTIFPVPPNNSNN